MFHRSQFFKEFLDIILFQVVRIPLRWSLFLATFYALLCSSYNRSSRILHFSPMMKFLLF